ncbi:MAG: diphosphomevalonate decarboxylase, partial [Gammaproteobacteria bacterium]
MVITQPLLQSSAFAPSNIALCKYWGKRSVELNLPVNSSLSISLGNKGAFTKVSLINHRQDLVLVNNHPTDPKDQFYVKLVKFLDLFREQLPDQHTAFKVDTYANIPIAAGLASSACGFAALVKALDQLFGWNYSLKQLSILARLGSGSACRSIFNGFVKWHKGILADGTDSFAEPLEQSWTDLCIGLLIVSSEKKYIISRDAMLLSVATSPLYASWEELASKDLALLENAINNQDFELFGTTLEANALAMHSIMLSSRPSIMYSNADTILNIKKIWQLRKERKLSLYFTQDAGPNL